MGHILIPKLKLTPTKGREVNYESMLEFLQRCDTHLALDVETTGLNPMTDTIVSVAITTKDESLVIDLTALNAKDRLSLWSEINRLGFYCYNSVFDGTMIEAELRRHLPAPTVGLLSNIVGDTLIMYKLFANEGFTGQRHNLETFINEVLGWPVSNKDTIASILKSEGLTKKDMALLLHTEHRDTFLLYNLQDSIACYQGMQYLRKLAQDKWPMVLEAHSWYVNLINLIIEQYFSGIQVDLEGLKQYRIDLEKEIETLTAQWYALPEQAERIKEWNTTNALPPKLKVKKIYAKKSDAPWSTAGWTREDLIDGQNYTAWEKEQGSRFYREEHTVVFPTKQKTFNIKGKNVKQCLTWLYYHSGMINWKYTRQHMEEFDKFGRPLLGEIEITLPCGNKVPLELTASGVLPVDKNALVFFGESGKLLNKIRKKEKLIQFLNSLEAVAPEGTWHVTLRPFGTITGRSSGDSNSEHKGKVSPQILPKDERFMRLIKCREGWSIVTSDYASLENVILAELSRDKLLMEVYASGKGHDGYLYPAIMFDPEGAEIAKVYCPDNPTKESVDAAKKQFKKIRNKWKVLLLAGAYGSGAEKKRRTLMKDGIFQTVEESVADHKAYLKSQEGVEVWAKGLEEERKRNRSWLSSPLGLPVCCPDDYKKDLKNRIIQKTGANILHKRIEIINRLRSERNVVMVPYNIDVHDNTVWTFPDSEKDNVHKIMEDSLQEVNDWLGDGKLIPMKADPSYGKDYWLASGY